MGGELARERWQDIVSEVKKRENMTWEPVIEAGCARKKKFGRSLQAQSFGSIDVFSEFHLGHRTKNP